jgi:hypothetical protein
VTELLFPQQTLRETEFWARQFASQWASDFPTQMDTREIGDGGSPRWRADFSRWITNAPDEQRSRVAQVMRQLRSRVPREYEVAYRVLILGESFEEVTKWLNERAQRNNIALLPGRDVHYRVKDALAIFVMAIDYVRAHY